MIKWKGSGLSVFMLPDFSLKTSLWRLKQSQALIVETKICLLFRAAAFMMKTGPVVTLKVAKFAAGYHGLGPLLHKPTSEQHSGKSNMITLDFLLCFFFLINPFQLLVTKSRFPLPWGGEGYAYPKSTAFILHSVNPQPSEHLHGNSRRKKEQLMQRNRQLYRSNPNITGG